MDLICKGTENSRLNLDFLEKNTAPINQIVNYFNVSINEAFMIAIIYSLSKKKENVTFDTLVDHFKCSTMKLHNFNFDIEILCNKGIINRRKIATEDNPAVNVFEYSIGDHIQEAIQNDKPLPAIQWKSYITDLRIIEKLHKLTFERNSGKISTHTLFNKAKVIFEDNQNLPLINKLYNLDLDFADIYSFTYVLWESLTNTSKVPLGISTDLILDDTPSQLLYVQTILSGENMLCKKNFIHISEPYFLNDAKITLTKYSVDWLENLGLRLSSQRQTTGSLLHAAAIVEQELIYTPKNQGQIQVLESALMENHLLEIQSRNLPNLLKPEMAALLYGPPGTGKTTTVYQIARATNRDIIHFDLSQTDLLNEGIKIIEGLFDDYQAYVKDCAHLPILWISHAEHILSRAEDIQDYALSKVVSDLQSALLSNLYCFRGIFIATTNRPKNFDIEIENRFVFKIEFQIPNKETAAKIWKSKIPLLSIRECKCLSKKFNFSGAQIDLIVEMKEIQEVILGIHMKYQNIYDFCKEEFKPIPKKNNR